MTALPLTGGGDELHLVRSWTRAHLTDVEPDVVIDIVQVVDELTSNAVSHGGPPRCVRLLRRPGLVRIEVDDSTAARAHPRPPDDNGGRGLHLVDAVCVAWGQEVTATGKTVWAELAVGPIATNGNGTANGNGTTNGDGNGNGTNNHGTGNGNGTGSVG
ncbi:ATP-binding protein [Amycolatopsis rhabdoformis]|uniref:ATP-binding protein n=1 Tax=Amycolatopsis rhabdoformis TaxID=1448059 RepID=A0ABZ1HVJ5_9PSEU|nr:ATP-binding protein [Amycolatopsis rhabdoformis]WSE26263.1 ATP-binding protein [Amycolatopsis rhabdoformis]